jgi:PrcB C-terminal
LAGMLAKLFKVDRIDWDKQMVVVIVAPKQSAGGYRVELDKLERGAREVIVRWKLVGPKPGTPANQGVAPPALTLLVERFPGPVRFDPVAPPAGKDGAGDPGSKPAR